MEKAITHTRIVLMALLINICSISSGQQLDHQLRTSLKESYGYAEMILKPEPWLPILNGINSSDSNTLERVYFYPINPLPDSNSFVGKMSYAFVKINFENRLSDEGERIILLLDSFWVIKDTFLISRYEYSKGKRIYINEIWPNGYGMRMITYDVKHDQSMHPHKSKQSQSKLLSVINGRLRLQKEE